MNHLRSTESAILFIPRDSEACLRRASEVSLLLEFDFVTARAGVVVYFYL